MPKMTSNQDRRRHTTCALASLLAIVLMITGWCWSASSGPFGRSVPDAVDLHPSSDGPGASAVEVGREDKRTEVALDTEDKHPSAGRDSATITVVVERVQDAKPLQSVRVLLYRSSGGLQQFRFGVTDTTGSVQFTALGTGTYQVVEPAGSAGEVRRVVDGNASFVWRLRLPEAPRVQVLATDVNGTPISGAQVWRIDTVMPVMLSETDVSGLCAFSVSGGSARIAIRSAGFAPIEAPVSAISRNPLTVQLTPGGSTVYGQLSASVDGLHKQVCIVLISYNSAPPKPVAILTHMPGDGYAFPGLPTGDYAVMAVCDGYGSVFTPLSCAAAGPYLANLYIEQTPPLTGNAFPRNVKGDASSLVSIRMRSYKLAEVWTDAQGNFSVPGLPLGPADVHAAYGDRGTSRSVWITRDANRPLAIEIL